MELQPVEQRVATAWPLGGWQDLRVLLAVSGGADSVAMLRAMVRLKTAGNGQLEVMHFNHQWRGQESDADEAFVRELAAQFGLPCHIGRASDQPSTADFAENNSEASARAARYDFFRRIAEQLGARYLVTAHTADDQAETILHRIIRGTGISGLAGIGRVRVLGPVVTVMRPMLSIHRRELQEYLNRLGQSFCTDSTNVDLRFTRNRIRHQLLPCLAEYNAGVADALVRLGTLAAEMQAVVDTLIADLTESCVEYLTADCVRISAVNLARQPRYVVRELMIYAWRHQEWPMQAMSFVHWEQLADMVAATDECPPRRVFPGNIWATLRDNQLWLECQ